MVRNVTIDTVDLPAHAVLAIGNDYPNGYVVPPSTQTGPAHLRCLRNLDRFDTDGNVGHATPTRHVDTAWRRARHPDVGRGEYGKHLS
jgi:hypothetical protein